MVLRSKVIAIAAFSPGSLGGSHLRKMTTMGAL